MLHAYLVLSFGASCFANAEYRAMIPSSISIAMSDVYNKPDLFLLVTIHNRTRILLMSSVLNAMSQVKEVVTFLNVFGEMQIQSGTFPMNANVLTRDQDPTTSVMTILPR